MSRLQKRYSPADFLRYEVQMHELLTPWGQDHEKKPDNGITLFEYDPDEHHEQKITEFLTEAEIHPRLPRWTPDILVMPFITNKLGQAMGNTALAKAFVHNFKTKPAFDGEYAGPSISEYTRDTIDEGKNLALIFPHIEFADIGIGLGGLTRAMGKTKYIYENNYVLLNKLMTREEYKGKKIADRLRAAGKSVWLMPDTKSTKHWGIPREIFYIVNVGAGEVLDAALDDPKNGVLLSEAPAASGMLPIFNKEGEIVAYEFPEMPKTAPSSLQKIEAALPIALRTNPLTKQMEWKIGGYVKPDKFDGFSQLEINRGFMDKVMLKLKNLTEELTGVEVIYNKLVPALGSTALKGFTSPEN